MSLINQALRKAQQDRRPNKMAEPGQSASTGQMGRQPSSGLQPGIVIGLIVVVALLVGLVAGLSVVLFRSDSGAARSENIAQDETAPEAAPELKPLLEASETRPAPSATAPASAEAATDTPPQTPSALSQEESSNTVAPSLADELRIAREAAEAKLQAEAEAKAQAEAEARAKATAEAEAQAKAEAEAEAKIPRIVEWLTNSRISGVRISPNKNESKVILNGKAYAVGEYVNFQLGLKVLVVEESRVLFVDDNGKKYMKRL